MLLPTCMVLPTIYIATNFGTGGHVFYVATNFEIGSGYTIIHFQNWVWLGDKKSLTLCGGDLLIVKSTTWHCVLRKY